MILIILNWITFFLDHHVMRPNSNFFRSHCNRPLHLDFLYNFLSPHFGSLARYFVSAALQFTRPECRARLFDQPATRRQKLNIWIIIK